MAVLTLIVSRIRLLSCHAKTDRGATLVEYALLVALIAVVCISAVTTFHQEVGSSFDSSAKFIAP